MTKANAVKLIMILGITFALIVLVVAVLPRYSVECKIEREFSELKSVTGGYISESCK